MITGLHPTLSIHLPTCGRASRLPLTPIPNTQLAVATSPPAETMYFARWIIMLYPAMNVNNAPASR